MDISRGPPNDQNLPTVHLRSDLYLYIYIYILYSNMVIGTLAVEWWTVTFGTVRRGLGGLRTAV